MSSMELSLADGWTQVEPKETDFELLISGQSPEQNLVLSDTAFRHRREIGFSGGSNCPLAVDETGGRVFVSVDEIVSYGLHGGVGEVSQISEDASPVWMLSYNPTGPKLLMHLHGEEPMESFVASLNLDSGNIEKQLLPEEAFVPLALNVACDKVLYSSRQGGAAVYDLKNEVSTVASVKVASWVQAGTFDNDERRVILGGDGLWGWDTVCGSTSCLCEQGTCPAIDGDGGVWFSLNDGALAKIGAEAGTFEAVVELSGMNVSDYTGGSYAQPMIFSPDGRYGLATLTGNTELKGKELAEAEAFCKQVDQPFSDHHRHRYHHYFCVLDLELQEAWSGEGYAHNVAWITSEH